MPKKRTQNLKFYQGTSVGSKQSSGKSESKQNATVNERLGQLRKIQGSDAVLKKREFADASATHQSVPPSLRGLLGIPETQPPQPRHGRRPRMVARVPGPAAPRSWLKIRPAWSSTVALRKGGESKVHLSVERSRPGRLLRFASMAGLESQNFEHGIPTLLHLSLKVAAGHWDLFSREDYPALVELPLRLRLRLLSYISYYGPPIDLAVVEALTYSAEPVQSLDLAGLVGYGNLTLRRLVKLMKDAIPRPSVTEVANSIAESWDLEESFDAALTLGSSVSRFSHLTHLSLSHPAPGISWHDLLSLSKQVPKLTHLSLAYWPRPTLTPNLATTTISSAHGPDVTAGGSHYYSGIDQDFSEPASLLRQLSNNLLCLQWLDLEGCAAWMPALALQDEPTSSDPDSGFVSLVKRSSLAIIFTDSWKDLKYLNCPQGWVPSLSGMKSLPRQTIAPAHKQIVDAFIKSDEARDFGESSNDALDSARRRAAVWVETEQRCIRASVEINTFRRSHACKPIVFDHGWMKRSF